MWVFSLVPESNMQINKIERATKCTTLFAQKIQLKQFEFLEVNPTHSGEESR